MYFKIAATDPDKKDFGPREDPKKKYQPQPEKKPEECACQPIETQPKIKKNDQEVQALIDFENKLHDNIYVKL